LTCRALVDSAHLRALKGGSTPGRIPSTAASPVPSHHLITDATGIPLAVTLTGGNRNEITQLIPLIDAIPTDPRSGRATETQTMASLRRPRLRPRQVPSPVRARGITPVIALGGVGLGSGPGPGSVPGRADIRLVARLPATTHPRRTASRCSPGSPQPGLLDYLPPPTHSELNH
jgi:hypothetical protein